MAKTKTTYTDVNVADFINAYVSSDQKKADSFQLTKLIRDWSGYQAVMWGPSIIGFGNYHYTYASGHEGDAPILGFSPRKDAFSLYVFSPTEKSKNLLDKLGKYKMTKGCIYIKKLADIDIDTLKEICEESIAYVHEHHQCGCREDNDK